MVNDLPRLSSVNGIAHPHRPNDDTAAQIRAIAELGAHLLEGAGCLIAWQGARAAATVRAVSASHLTPASIHSSRCSSATNAIAVFARITAVGPFDLVTTNSR